ncbi:MAG TPA: dihydroorotase family protein [Candidatus Acidoferrales bacterium]|nr:dihydroorotase family protein [Candidatus Acidoferrales bacterium]
MIVDSVLTNAKAYLKERRQIVDCCIAIEEGKIQKIGKETQMPSADEKTDLHGLLVLPGLIDEHVHLRDEGRAYKEDFTSGTAAAAAGGFTTVLDMPNNDPVTMSVKRLENRMELARRRILVNVGFYSEFPKTTPEIKEIANAGAVAFKLFMGNQTGGLNVDDDAAIVEAFKAVAATERLVAVHAEDRAMLAATEEKLKHNKKSIPTDYLRAHTEAVELYAVKRLLKLTQKMDNLKLHFCHISTKDALEAITEAKKDERKVTCEVTPNHLMLTSDEINRIGGLAIMAPPLRERLHVDALWKGIEDGTVDTLGSDHAPHTLEEKLASSVWEVKAGIPGLEVTLPLMLTMVRKNKITINQVVELLAEKPAALYGLADRGKLEAGLNADLTIIDYGKFKIETAKFKTKAKFSPYNGWEVYGKPAKTIVNGTLVYDDGDIVAKSGIGKVLRGGSA